MEITDLLFVLHPKVLWGMGGITLILASFSGLRLGLVSRLVYFVMLFLSTVVYGYQLFDFIQHEFSMRAVVLQLRLMSAHQLENVCQVILNGVLDPFYLDIWLTTMFISFVAWQTAKRAARYIPIAQLKHKTKVVDARWMMIDHAKKIFKEGDLIIGEAIEIMGNKRSKWSNASLLKFKGETHLLTCSGTGGGKTTSVTIPNFLNYPYSLVVLDPKTDISDEMISARQLKFQKDIAVINPHKQSHSLNVLALCDVSTPKVLTHIRSITKWICGEKEGTHHDQYFTESAHSLIECLIAYELFLHPKSPSLRRVRDNLSLPLDKLQTLLKSIYEMPEEFGFGIPQKIAGPLYNIPSKQFAGTAGIADTATKFLIDESVLQCVTDHSIDIEQLRSGELDIVIQLSLEVMGAYPGLSRILLGSILYYVYQNRPQHQALFLIDEMPRLGYMRLLEEARDVGRGLGIKLWVIVQELGQLRKLYGQDGISAWLENTGIQQFFGIKGLETAKRLVETLGETMVDISSVSLNQSENSKESRSVSTQKQKRSLITVDEIIQLGQENQLILSEHNKPLKCAKSPYYRRKEFMKLLK